MANSLRKKATTPHPPPPQESDLLVLFGPKIFLCFMQIHISFLLISRAGPRITHTLHGFQHSGPFLQFSYVFLLILWIYGKGKRDQPHNRCVRKRSFEAQKCEDAPRALKIIENHTFKGFSKMLLSSRPFCRFAHQKHIPNSKMTVSLETFAFL